MRPRLHTIFAGCAVVAAALAMSVSAVADVGAKRHAMRPPALHCSPAAIETIHLPGTVAVDEIRVVVAPGSPDVGAVDVEVDAGASDRVVRVRGNSSRGLQFSPALEASRFHVALNPVFEAPTGACVERVVLLRAGVPVAVVRP